ncbi:GerMN domain-containing protein [Ilumatobacter nonamiensis]|uniref:GerMN domain-containing protein n=1 Tax=Ilumatobacter nonamiensis TaxID=467093 RepID=UPI00034B326D|nr:GerMN domain-containing protein [Ilumatobacter nonamiensis]
MRRLVGLLSAFAVVVLASCTITEDSAPTDIPVDQQGNFGELATGDAAVGGSRIYLLSPVGTDDQALLRAVPRSDATNPEELLTSLIAGANADESTTGLSSAVPADLEILDASTVGTRLTVDINEALAELSDQGLRLALAQIVATSSEIDQVRQVRLRVNGQNQGWPTGDGEVTDRPLTLYDYPGFLETSQPDFPALPLPSA